MRYLLDTHALIWWWADNPRLPVPIRALIQEPHSRIFISPVSALEMAIKVRNWKLEKMQEAVQNFHEWIEDEGFVSVDITCDHAREAGLLEGEHRDPFDRLIAAQSIIEKIPVISRDPALASLGCETVW